jgi:hypothetical protein
MVASCWVVPTVSDRDRPATDSIDAFDRELYETQVKQQL